MELFGADYAALSGGGGGMAGLGDTLSEELKDRVRRALQAKGYNKGQGAFVTEQALARAPYLGDFMTEQALADATVGTGLPARAGGGPPRAGEVADLSIFHDSSADSHLI